MIYIYIYIFIFIKRHALFIILRYEIGKINLSQVILGSIWLEHSVYNVNVQGVIALLCTTKTVNGLTRTIWFAHGHLNEYLKVNFITPEPIASSFCEILECTYTSGLNYYESSVIKAWLILKNFQTWLLTAAQSPANPKICWKSLAIDVS